LEIRAEARYLSSVAKSDAHSNELANAQIQGRNHARGRRRAAQQNMTTEPEEEDRLTETSHAHARHRTAHQVITPELEEEDQLAVAPLAEHGLDVAPEEEVGDSQSPRMSGAQQCIKGSHLGAGATTSASASAPAAASHQGTLTNDVHSLLDCSRQSHPSSHCAKPQSLSGLSSALAKRDNDASYSMPTNNRLQRDSDGHQTDPAGIDVTPQSSPESVHEPLLITSKRQILPISWGKACRRPGSAPLAQVSRFFCYFFVIILLSLLFFLTITIIIITTTTIVIIIIIILILILIIINTIILVLCML